MDRSLSLCLALLLTASSSVANAQDAPPEEPRPRPPAQKPAAPKKKAPPPEVIEEAPAPEDDPLEAMSVPATELEPQADAETDADADADEADDEAATKTKPVAKAAPVKKTPAVVTMTALQPAILPYEEGQTIPEGYTPDSRPRTGLIIGGAITFLVPYLSSVAIALRAQGDARQGYISQHKAEELAPLYIPIAGPFIAIGTDDRDDASEIAPFVAAGVVQAAGAGMLLAGIFSRKQVLVRKQATVTPLVSPGTVGLSATGSF